MLTVGIVGTGPSAFYLAMRLLKLSPSVQIDLFERSQFPYGLLRYGVAPDSLAIKDVQEKYLSLLKDPRVHYYGNVNVGTDVSFEKLKECYNAVAISTGMPDAKPSEITGAAVYTAKEVFGAYNSDPAAALSLSFLGRHFSASVVGLGNVALDICRILMTPPANLYYTDINSDFQGFLESHNCTQINLIGRRGPAGMAFTAAEMRELLSLPGVEFYADDALWDTVEEIPQNKSRLLKLMREAFRPLSQRSTESSKRVCLHFNLEYRRSENGSIVFGYKGRPEECSFPSDLVVTCFGSYNASLDYFPLNSDTTIMNQSGRILNHPGFYVCGWARKGAHGTLSDAMYDAWEVAASIISDCRDTQTPCSHVSSLLKPSYVPKSAWLNANLLELQNGLRLGKWRDKLTQIAHNASNC